MKFRGLCAFLFSTLAFTAHDAVFAQSGPPPVPALTLVLKPHAVEGKVDYVEGRLTIERPDAAAGGVLLRMPLLIVSIPTARYDGDAIKATDAQGDLALTQKEEPPTPTGTYRQWLASRATSGDVTVTFRAPPRVITPTTRTGPLFDLRADDGGVLGAGISFLPLPETRQPHRISLKWDLSGLPAGARGVTSLGEGDINTVGPPERLAFCFYAVGPLKSFPPEGSKDFAMYWLSDLPFDPAALAGSIQKLYGYMSAFFHDEGKPYRVFIRKNVNRLGGGTALPQSFMFGWNEGRAPTLDDLQSLLAHEMTHNWPGLAGDHGATAWYSEGTAEFYSILLSYRSGVLTSQQLLDELNQRASGYYTNPYLNATNTEAAKVFWSDWSAQRVPYGRGFMYIAQVDAKIRAKSRGKRSLDDIVVKLFEQKKQGKEPTIEDWLRLVKAELGSQAQKDYDAMVAGHTIVPPSNSFGPCFKPVKNRERPFVLGVASDSFSGERRVVQGLVKGTAAEASGLRNGDEIIEFTDPLEVQKAPDAMMKLKVGRDGKELQLEYMPRGAEIDTYRWERVPAVPDAKCKV